MAITPRYRMGGGGKGFLHPTHAPAKAPLMIGGQPMNIGGHQHVAPEKLKRQLSGKDAGETLSRFGRATGAQNKEFAAQIHPISGRMMTLTRGQEHGAYPRVEVTRTQDRAKKLAERTSNPEVRRRAEAISAPVGQRPGLHPIIAHNHPKKYGRSHPSGQDLTGGLNEHSQNVVVTRRPQRQRGGKNTSMVWSGRKGQTTQREIAGITTRDLGTQTGELSNINGKGVARLGAGFRGVQRLRGKSTDYDAMVHAAHGGKTKHSIYTRQQFGKRKGTEFNSGSTYERYSGESTRNRVTAEGAALGGLAGGAGLASSSLAGAKLAGTPIGQSALGAAHEHVSASARLTHKPEHRLAADQIRRYKKYGEAVGRHKLKTSAGIIGLGGVATLARIGQKHRQNEESGISQGIGRMKAGEHYAGVQHRASFAKAGMTTIGLASDVLTHPKAGPLILQNKHKIGAAAAGATGVVGGATLVRSSQKHEREYRKLRGELHATGKSSVAKLYARDRQTSLPHLVTAGAGLALGAWGFGRSGMVGRALGRGIKVAQGHQNHTAVQALQQAQALQGILARGTAPGERQLRQIRSVDRAISRVPSALRPEIALAAGTLLVGHSRPIRRDTYHPVNIRVRTFGGY